MAVFRASSARRAAVQDGDWIVPREPSPVADPFVDGPTERLHDPDPDPDGGDGPGRSGPGRGVGFAVALSLVAVLLSAGAGLLAWRALTEADLAHRPSASLPSTGFDPGYDDESLRIRIGCAATMYLDLDEPRVNVTPPGGDLRYDNKCGREGPLLSLGPGARSGSQVTTPDLDAPGCARTIRTSPLGPGTTVPVRSGAALCVLTGAAPPRMVLVRITQLSSGGTATMSATSWSIPGR